MRESVIALSSDEEEPDQPPNKVPIDKSYFRKALFFFQRRKSDDLLEPQVTVTMVAKEPKIDTVTLDSDDEGQMVGPPKKSPSGEDKSPDLIMLIDDDAQKPERRPTKVLVIDSDSDTETALPEKSDTVVTNGSQSQIFEEPPNLQPPTEYPKDEESITQVNTSSGGQVDLNPRF